MMSRPFASRSSVASCSSIVEIHESNGHHGIKRTLYFSRKLSPAVTRKEVQRVVKACPVCQSVDPAPVKWTRGELNVDKIYFIYLFKTYLDRVSHSVKHCFSM